MGRRLLIGVVVGSVAVVAAWSLVSDGKALWTVVAGAVAAVTGAFSPWLVDRLRGRWDARDRRRRDLTGSQVAELPASVAWLLHPAKEVIDFFGRGWVLRQLETWCADKDAAVVRLVTAPGGYGKTRLARRFASRLSGWENWWIRVGGENDAAAAIDSGDAPGRLLMIIDYADSREPAALATVLVAAACGAHGRDSVRLLLLARSAGPWWTSLSASYPEQAAMVDALTVAGNVIKLPAQADERHSDEIVTCAVDEFATHLRRVVPRDFQPRHHDRDTSLLRLHAEALLAVLGGPSSGDRRYDVLGEVLGHEARYWRGCARRAGLVLPSNVQQADTLLRQVVGIAALLGAEDQSEIAGIVRRAPMLASAEPAAVSAWVDWLGELYPPDGTNVAPGRLGTLQPDLLAEFLSVEVLRACTDQQRAVIFEGLASTQAIQALTMLGRAGQDRHADVPALIGSALATDTSTMAYAVLRVAPQFPGFFAAQLATLLETADLDPDQLRALARAVPYPSRELCVVALALTTRIVGQDAATSAADKATWRTWHALRLASVGRWAEALTFSAEAVELYRELVAGNRDAYLPDLARSVNNHANRLASVGRLAEALTFSAEAVELYRELVAGNRDAYLPDLATSVNNHALRLAEVGRLAEALTVSAEAVELRRGLVAGNRDAYLPDLAASVGNHAVRLAEVGRRAEALTASGEAVALYRGLVAGNRDADLPNLAASLWITAWVYLTVGRPTEHAVAAGSEAIQLFEELAAAYPEAFTGRLRASAETLAKIHDAMGDPLVAAQLRARFET